MKNHILIAGIATLMLASCAQKNQTELTLSGLNPTKFQTVVNDAQTDLIH
jgi:aldose 1-epimerase